MGFILFAFALAAFVALFVIEREATLRGSSWTKRVDYVHRPFLLGSACLVLGFLVWAIPPHSDAAAGAGAIVWICGSAATETRYSRVRQNRRWWHDAVDPLGSSGTSFFR